MLASVVSAQVLSRIWLGFFVLLSSTAACAFAIVGNVILALTLSSLASAILIALVRVATGSFTNLSLVFVVFSAVYGLSGPVAALSSDGLPMVFPKPYLINEFIVHYSLAVFAMGIVFMASPSCSSKVTYRARTKRILDSRSLLSLAVLLAFTSSSMEVVNGLRSGGVAVWLQGKAVYQSAVAELTGTLPATQVLLLATAILGIGIATTLRARKHVIWFIVFCLPILGVLMFLGRRGVLLAIIFTFVVSKNFFTPITRFRPKWVVLGIVLYVSMAFVFGNRGVFGHVIETGRWEIVSERTLQADFWIRVLNPSANEFGAAFGNFNTYALYGSENLRWGETYLNGFTLIVPRSIWPKKPRSVVYEFRDEFFPGYASRAAIAGTAFSSILEARMNFGTAGVPIIYFFVCLGLTWLERRRLHTQSLWFMVFYLSLIPFVVSFHRSSLQMPLFWPLLQASLAVIGYRVFRRFRHSFPSGRGVALT